MNFIQLNGRKIWFRLLINLSSYSILALILYAIIKKHNDPQDVTEIMLILVYGFGLIWFLLFFFFGWHAFRISRKLLTSISTLAIFDDNIFSFGYLEKNSNITYTKKCIWGKIDGYPVIVSFHLATGKGQTSRLDFEVITIKFNHPHTELVSVNLDWLRGYEPIGDVKKEINGFIENLKAKSIAMGDFEAVFADKYLTPSEDCN